MKKILFQIFFTLCLVAITAMIGSCKPSGEQARERQELLTMKAVIEKQLQNEAQCISSRLSAFSKVASSDRDFSMKLFVEANRSAPEVTDLTFRFMEPMGFSLLEITDSAQVLLSCAQFPASTGTNVADKAGLLGERAQFIVDNLKGQKVLTLQSKARFRILDTLFYCIGGRIVDEGFISQLSPGSGFRLVLKQGDMVLGMNNNRRISDFKDSTVVIDATVYPAVSIPLPFAGKEETPFLILINEKAVIQKS
jgi:hypothetical protein